MDNPSKHTSSERKMQRRETYSLESEETMSYSAPYKSNEEYIEAVITIPPDGGWGWVVVLSSFLCNLVSDGAIYTFSIFLKDISETFDTYETTVALANSLMTGILYITGPMICGLVNHAGFQTTGFIGGVISALAFGCSSLATSVDVFIAVLGVVGGIGLCAVYVPSIVVIGFYFERWRALATSIAVTGSAVGIVIFPIIMQEFLKEFTWQTKFQILSGFFFLLALVALLYRPLKPVRVLTTQDKEIIPLNDSVGSFHPDKKPGLLKRIFKRFHNRAYPTHSQLYRESTFIMTIPIGPSTSSIFINSVNEETESTFMKTSSSRYESRSERLDKLSTVYENSSLYKKKWKCCRKCCCNFRLCKWCCHAQAPNRPMYRDDIFYHLSLSTIPEYAQQARMSRSSKIKNVDYAMSVTRVSLMRGQKEKLHCKCCHESLIRTLVTMLNFDLLKSPAFTCLAVSGFFTVLGMYIPFIYLVQKAKEIGIESDMSVHLFTAIGIANGIGRVINGLISTIPQAKPLIVSYISLFISGISTILSYFLIDLISQFIYVVVYGLTIASVAALRSCIIVDLLGLEKLTNAFGLLLLFFGFAAFIGVPLAGKIVQSSNSFNNSYIFSGSMLTFSALLLLPIKWISDWEKKRASNK